VELRPDVSDYHADVASAQNALRRFQEAEGHARTAVRLWPTSAMAHFQLGVALAGQERLNDARQALAEAVRLAPRAAEYRAELDRVRRRGDPARADTIRINPAYGASTGTGGIATRAYDIPAISANVESIQFYEGRSTLARGQRMYRYRFRRDSLRWVSYEVNLRHPTPPQSTSFELVAVYTPVSTTSPAGRGEWFRDTLRSSVITLGPSFHTRTRGFETPGKWGLGAYRVDFFHQGQRVASSAFEVVDSPLADIPTAGGRLTKLRFFEGGTARPAEIDRRYQYRFAASTSRYLYVAVELAFFYRPQRVDLPLQVIYYSPEGRELGRTGFSDAYVPAGYTVTFPYTNTGFGYGEPGKWSPGRYRVDVMSASRRITSGWFDIY
jgi:hypothetical protein